MSLDHQEIFAARVFNTPPRVLDLIMHPDNDQAHFSASDIRSKLQQSITMDIIVGDKTPTVYLADVVEIPLRLSQHFLPEILDPKNEPESLNDIVQSISRVRAEVVAWLRENGVTVTEISQSYFTKTGADRKQARQCSVGTIKQHPDYVYKRRQERAPAVHLIEPETIELPRHPHLVHEIIHRKPGGEYITIAERLPDDHKTLASLLNGKKEHEIASYILQAMKGCEHILANGYVHGDVKPENIVVLPSTGTAKLFDLEGITKVQEKTSHLAQPDYNEDEYYGRDAHKKVDGKTDVFSFGITLLGDISTLIPQQYIDQQIGKESRKDQNKKNEVEHVLHQFLDRYRPFMNGRLKKLIKVMTLAEREKRPSLSDAITELTQIIEEIKRCDIDEKQTLF